MEDHPCAAVIGSVSRFLMVLTEKTRGLGIDITDKEIDHVCYRCESKREYQKVCQELAVFGVILLESMIGGRPIAMVSLTEPIKYDVWNIRCIEVTCPKPGKQHPLGLEHAEVVIGTPSDGIYASESHLRSFQQQYPDITFDEKAIKKEANADISITLLEGMSIKFHARPVYEVIAEELLTGHVEQIPEGYFSGDTSDQTPRKNQSITLPTSLDGAIVSMRFPPREESDNDVAELLSNGVAMEHLVAMARISTGGWNASDASQRRTRQAIEHSSGQSLNGTIHVKNPEGDHNDNGADDAFAGIGGFRSIDWWNRSAEMGIILDPRWWRKGISVDVHFICLSYAFEELCLNRVEFKTASSNTAMIKFCKDVLGATHEGTLRDFTPATNTSHSFQLYTPMELLSVLAHEWPSAKRKLLLKLQQRN